MKKTIKLIPALIMLLISAILVSTSTFAWFSMNTTVIAQNMQIKAVSENQFLQIVNNTDAFNNSIAQTEANADIATKNVRPTSAVKAFTTTTLTALTTTEDTSDIKFVEAFSNNPADSARATNYQEVTTAATANDSSNVYTLINTFRVRLNPTTGVSSANNLTVQSVTITATDAEKEQLLPSVRVLITCGDEWALWSNGASVISSNTNIIAATVTDDVSPNTATTIVVYIFFDGENAATTTNNATTVGTDGYNIVFTLGIN